MIINNSVYNVSNIHTLNFKGNNEIPQVSPEIREVHDNSISSKAITAMVQGGINAQTNPLDTAKERQTLIDSLKSTVFKETYPKLDTMELEELRKLNNLMKLEGVNRAGQKIPIVDYWGKHHINKILDNKYDINSIIDCAKLTYVDENGISKNIFKISDIVELLKEGVDITSSEFKTLAGITRDDANYTNTYHFYGDSFDSLHNSDEKKFYHESWRSRHRAPRFNYYDIKEILSSNIDINSERFKELLDAKLVTDTGESRPLLDSYEIVHYYPTKAKAVNLEKIVPLLIYDENGEMHRMFFRYSDVIDAAQSKDIETIVEMAKLRDYGKPNVPSVFTGHEIVNLLDKDVSLKITLQLTKDALKKANGAGLPTYAIYDITKQAQIFSEKEKELKELLSLVKDEEFKAVFERFYVSNRLENIDDAIKALDAYNNLKNNYTTLELSNGKTPYFKEYMDYCKEQDIDIRQDSNVTKRYADFIEDQKIGQLVDFCKNHDNELSNYMYENIYLKERTLPPEIKQICSEINKKYGSKLFLPVTFDGYSIQYVEYIQKELSAWKEASNGKAKYPLVIDLLNAKRDYIDPKSAYGKNCSAGFQSGKEIALDGYDHVGHNIFRHELTHLNDEKQLWSFPSDWYKTGGCVTDFIKNKFRDEFAKGGINLDHIDYAFNNPKEFIAVAAEGDFSQYSSNFIHQLKEFGIPDWIVNLRKTLR